MQKLGAVRRALDAGELDIVLSRLKYAHKYIIFTYLW